MYQKLEKHGINVPNGFAITAYAYRYFLKYAGIEDEIKKILKDLDTGDMQNLMRKGREVRDVIRHAEFPPDLTQAIYQGYDELAKEFGHEGLDDLDVAIRSSATAEGPAGRLVCRPAGHVPQHPRPVACAGRVPEVLCLAFHEPGHLVPP